jgi:hypothetical protein
MYLVIVDLFVVQEFILQYDGRPAGQIKLNPRSRAIRTMKLLVLDRAVTTNNEFNFLFFNSLQWPTSALLIDKLLHFVN